MRYGALAGLVLVAALGAWRAGFLGNRTPSLDQHWALLDRYCVDCHNQSEFAGNVAFDTLAPTDLPEKPELFEKVVRKLGGHLMPPPGSPRPEQAEIDTFVASLEANLDAASGSAPHPGYVTVHRLNRREYAAAIDELLGLEIDPADFLPNDLKSDGFDNIADVLRISPAFFDQYIAAAREISLRAIGNPDAAVDRRILLASRDLQNGHIDGLPLGTRGGLVEHQSFPADGEYEFSIDVRTVQGDELRAYPDGWIEFRHKVILTIDGERVFEDEIGGDEDSRAIDQRQITAFHEIRSRFQNIRVPVTAGVHEIGATFVARTFAESDKLLEPIVPGTGERSIPSIYGVEVVGPYAPTGIAGTTVGRRHVFVCRPEGAEDELPCARKILGNLARQAFRRPVTDADLETLLGFYRDGAAEAGFDAGVQHGLMAILASPKFLFRTPEAPPPELAPGATYAVSDLELASRLSFFIWGRGPDERLLELAEQGRLGDRKVLDAEVERMLADTRSKSLVTDFAFQWLALDGINVIDPDPRLFPNFTNDLRAAFLTEMELYLDSVLRADRSVLDLLDAKETFVNERLARHYGIKSVRGDHVRRIELEDSNRWGLFGKGAVLMLTSYPHRTSPVLRGIWVMDHILATPPSPPPPGVETDLDKSTEALGEALTVRGRLEMHRADPACSHCHGVIDPLGLALENFDAIGEWRDVERDQGLPIDASGQLASGEPVRGPEDLRNALLAQPELFLTALTEKLMTYAIGRRLEYYDMPTVRAVVREARRTDDYRFSSLVRAVVASPAFRMRSVPDDLPLTLESKAPDASIAAVDR
jgi:hypothetical protein